MPEDVNSPIFWVRDLWAPSGLLRHPALRPQRAAGLGGKSLEVWVELTGAISGCPSGGRNRRQVRVRASKVVNKRCPDGEAVTPHKVIPRDQGLVSKIETENI